MRYLIVLVLLVGFSFVNAQQSEVDKLLKQGKTLFNHDLHEDAINKYKQAIAFDKKCSEAYYELAYTYLTLLDWDEALHYSRITLGFEDEYWLDAILIYGTVLTNKGNPKQAIREYKRVVKKYPDESLLYYNMAISYHNLKEYDKAEEALKKSIQLNKLHIPSHLMLSSIMKQKGEILKSMLPLYYSLLLESDNDKKQEILSDLQVRWHVSLVQKGKIKMPISKHSKQSGLLLAESELNTLAREVSVNYPEQPFMLINQTVRLLELLAEVQTGEMDFFDIYYVDFFITLFGAGHVESFSYFICSASYNPEVLLWVGDNQSSFSAFINWMELQQ